MLSTMNTQGGDIHLRAQVAVVGSGAGGASVAHMLSQAGLDVVVLEEGPWVASTDLGGELDSLMVRLYRDEGLTPIFGRPNIAFGEGRCLGGSTVINGALCWRPPEGLLEDWSRYFALPAMGLRDLEPHLAQVEQDLSVHVPDNPQGNQASRLLVQASQALGWRWEPAPRAQRDCQDSNRCPTGCPHGAKQSMLVTYLPQALSRGARIFCDTRVTRVLNDGHRARGVEAVVRGKDRHQRLRVDAEEVFVCAGPLQTPFLLGRSGCKGLGRGLQIHLNLKAVARFPQDIDPLRGTIMTAQVKEFQDDGIYLGSSNFDPVYLAVTLASRGEAETRRFMEQWRHCAIYLAQVKGNAKGAVRDLGLGRPLPFYLLADDDKQRLGQGLLRLVELLCAAGAQEVLLPLPGWPPLHAPEQARALLEKNPAVLNRADLISVHAAASCPLGGRGRPTPLGPYGQVRGLQGLHVCDASMLPGAPGVNPQLTLLAVARRNLIHFLNERGLAP